MNAQGAVESPRFQTEHLVSSFDNHAMSPGLLLVDERTAAAVIHDRLAEPSRVIWFEGHWGFQYYMQQWGATALNAADSKITSGDLIIFPANNTSIIPLPMDKLGPVETVQFPTLPLVSTHGHGTGAAFYSSARGTLPWAIDRIPPETYYVATFR